MRRLTVTTGPTTTIALSAAALLTISGCAGGVTGGGGGAGGGEGFDYGASDEDVAAAVADLEPTTLTYQIPATSANSPQYFMGAEFKEEVEKRSGGKITIELAWNQTVASYDEVHDALADGRLDLAFTLPTYDPSRFPAFNALNDVLGGDQTSPLVGEIADALVANQLAWESQPVLDELADNSVRPLNPVSNTSNYVTVCSKDASTLDGWKGTQVRVGSPAALEMVESVGGTPVSIAGVEAYEALQRGTIDCSLATVSDIAQGGFLEVAPHLSYTTDTSFPRVAGAILAGTSFDSLPLAYQQILFDAYDGTLQGGFDTVLTSKKMAVEQVHAGDTPMKEAESDLQDAIRSYADDKRAEIRDGGTIDAETVDSIEEIRAHWEKAIADAGYEDGGTLEDFDSWYDEETDFRPIAQQFFEEVMLDHRPS